MLAGADEDSECGARDVDGVDKRKEKESKGANDGTTERLIQERRDSGAGSGAADDSDRSQRFDHPSFGKVMSSASRWYFKLAQCFEKISAVAARIRVAGMTMLQHGGEAEEVSRSQCE